MNKTAKTALKVLLGVFVALILVIAGCGAYIYYEINKKNKELQLVEQQHSKGTPFVDFETEYNGKVAKLSDYVGKGQYTLVDFWASWCPPCRAEIPNLIAAHNKYAGKGLIVLGVAVSDEPADTEKAIKELGINYPQMINAGSTPAELYGISGIPHIILFGPDGNIVERGLRGERIEQKLAEIYQ